MGKKVLVIVPIIAGLSALGIGGYYVWNSKNRTVQQQPKQLQRQKESKPEVNFQFIKESEITEGHQVRILFARDRFIVIYRKPNQSVAVKILDAKLNPLEEKIIKNIIGPDYKIAFSSDYFYLSDANYLRKYDLNWNEIGSIDYFVKLPNEISKLWPHGVDDMILSSSEGSIYLGIPVGNAPPKSDDKASKKAGEKKPDLADNLLLQEFDSNLGLKKEALLKDIGNVPSSSLIKKVDELIIITGDRHWDDSSLMMLKFDKNWQLLERKAISNEEKANEEFPMAAFFADGIYFVSYRKISGDISQPTVKEPVTSSELIIKAYDSQWNLLARLPEQDDSADKITQTIKGWFDFAVVGNKIYLIFDGSQDKIILKEYLI